MGVIDLDHRPHRHSGHDGAGDVIVAAKANDMTKVSWSEPQPPPVGAWTIGIAIIFTGPRCQLGVSR
jgi:hypothetical protein